MALRLRGSRFGEGFTSCRLGGFPSTEARSPRISDCRVSSKVRPRDECGEASAAWTRRSGVELELRLSPLSDFGVTSCTSLLAALGIASLIGRLPTLLPSSGAAVLLLLPPCGAADAVALLATSGLDGRETYLLGGAGHTSASPGRQAVTCDSGTCAW